VQTGTRFFLDFLKIFFLFFFLALLTENLRETENLLSVKRENESCSHPAVLRLFDINIYIVVCDELVCYK